jgi:hypothetical protein
MTVLSTLHDVPSTFSSDVSLDLLWDDDLASTLAGELDSVSCLLTHPNLPVT